MAEDRVMQSLLLDFYGELLTDKQRECCELHFNEDLSLAEIAEQCGISRQGVWDNIRRGVAASAAFPRRRRGWTSWTRPPAHCSLSRWGRRARRWPKSSAGRSANCAREDRLWPSKAYPKN